MAHGALTRGRRLSRLKGTLTAALWSRLSLPFQPFPTLQPRSRLAHLFLVFPKVSWCLGLRIARRSFLRGRPSCRRVSAIQDGVARLFQHHVRQQDLFRNLQPGRRRPPSLNHRKPRRRKVRRQKASVDLRQAHGVH